jgi:type II secretory ATPase GspE/PulE/Tfp pilus assembly ATPase PilB-like protein
VLSTLHTNDAPGAIHRLLDMGIEPYLLAPALRCVVAQRLVAKVCSHCAAPAQPEPEQLTALGLSATQRHDGLRNGVGCTACRRKGRLGRMPIHEVLIVDAKVRRLIVARADLEEFQAVAVDSYRPLARDGVEKALAGLVPLDEVLAAVRAH